MITMSFNFRSFVMKFLRFLTLVISVAVVGSISGCVDKCKDQYCLNGGDCLDGDCECPTGYYGTHCEYSTSGGGGNGGGGGGSSSTGTVTFYNNQSNVGVITVYLGGSSSQITQTTVASSCPTSGCANFTVTLGSSYSWSASAATGEAWSGTNSFSSSCTTYNLY